MKYTALHLFCGLGGGALGFQRAGFRTLLGVDSSAPACADFAKLTGAPVLRADLSALSPSELSFACGERPDVVFTSPPCKAFSGCLPRKQSLTSTYQDMSDLSLRGIWIALEAWPTPPPLIILENVPRIQSRGAQWLSQITGLLRGYGYAVKAHTHDCGEVGGLGQRRRRFLLVARHIQQVPEVLYHPPLQRVRGCGEVLGALPIPLPGSKEGGPMHRLPKMSVMNWLRLALIPPGRDWRALPAEVALPSRSGRQNGQLGVVDWDAPAHTVVGQARPDVAWASVTDPRITKRRREGSMGVTPWTSPAVTIISHGSPQNGPWQVADPRLDHAPRPSCWGVVPWDSCSGTIRATEGYSRGSGSVADPRLSCSPRSGAYGVVGWDAAAPTVTAAGQHDNSAVSVADPRPVADIRPDDDETYTVIRDEDGTWHQPSLDVDDQSPKYIIIRGEDGTWHRPMTTLELAALQGLPVGDAQSGWLVLDGRSHAGWRERIGNAVPPPAAEAIAKQMIKTLDASREGGLLLGSTPVWVDRAHGCGGGWM